MKSIHWSIYIFIIITLSSLIACKDTQTIDQSQLPNKPVTEQDEINQADTNDDQDQTENVDENVTEENEITQPYTIDIYDTDSFSVLVNKQNSLPDHYEPEDLKTVEVPTILENPEVNQLRDAAAKGLKDMFERALEDGMTLYARSGYRSHQTQHQLFESYSERHGEEAANRYSARPGQSEHQTGLVMDVTSESVNYQLEEEFGETDEGLWIQEHAHKFGFIIRYPKDKENITGYIYEPWHLRYLGIELATAVYESNLTYEEFLVEEGILDDIDA